MQPWGLTFEESIRMAFAKSCLAKDWILGNSRYRLVFNIATDYRSDEFLAGAHLHGSLGSGAGIYCPGLKLSG
jgi:hypothetical protein